MWENKTVCDCIQLKKDCETPLWISYQSVAVEVLGQLCDTKVLSIWSLMDVLQSNITKKKNNITTYSTATAFLFCQHSLALRNN